MLDPNTINGIFVLLASLGLSLSAGVRAYLPLLAIGIASDVGNINGLQITLRPDFSWIGNPLFLVLLGFLTVYEFSADKIPVVDHINDAVHTFIRPLSGALIFTATNNLLSDSSMVGAVVAALIGGSIAGATHAVKAGVVRPASTVTTAGLANPVISLVEDVLSFGVILISILSPVIGAILFVVLAGSVTAGIARLLRRRRAKRIAAKQVALQSPYPTQTPYRR